MDKLVYNNRITLYLGVGNCLKKEMNHSLGVQRYRVEKAREHHCIYDLHRIPSLCDFFSSKMIASSWVRCYKSKTILWSNPGWTYLGIRHYTRIILTIRACNAKYLNSIGKTRCNSYSEMKILYIFNLLYGRENWTLDANTEKSIEAFDLLI